VSPSAEQPTVAIFGPDPLLSVTIEARGQRDEVHVHAAGQGVWVARMASARAAATSSIIVTAGAGDV